MKFDNIIIGTSPLSVIEATHLCSQGSVLSIEASNDIGGAWSTVKYDNLPEIEIGCHIWSYNREVYDFLHQVFNLNLVPLTPSPKIYTKGKFIPYDWKSSIVSLKEIAKSISLLNFKRLHQLRKSPAIRFNFTSANYLYPKLGAKELYQNLKKHADLNSLKIQFNTKIKALIITKNGVQLIDNNDSSYETKNLTITSLTDIDSVTFLDGTVLKINKQKMEYIHVHLLIKETKQKKREFSYIRVLKNSIIHRISDMTGQVKGEINSDEKLICLGIWESAYHEIDRSELASKCINQLKQMKLISKDAHLIKFNSNVFPSLYIDSEQLNEVSSKSNGRIKVLRTTDFIYSFYNKLEQYQSLLNRNS